MFLDPSPSKNLEEVLLKGVWDFSHKVYKHETQKMKKFGYENGN